MAQRRRGKAGTLGAAQKRALVRRALAASRHARAPYSGYHVGAAVLAAGGKVFPGCNVENAAYPLCLCAERVGLFSAVAAGHREFLAVAVATHSTPPASPCGSCRQVMHELGPSMTVLLCNHEGDVVETTVEALLPRAFGASELVKKPARAKR
jgi:cytidine deaminase